MEHIGKTFEHAKAPFYGVRDNGEASGSPSTEPAAIYSSLAHEQVSLASDISSSALSADTGDEQLLRKFIEDLRISKVQGLPVATAGQHNLGAMALGSLMNLPLPGAAFFAHSIKRALSQKASSVSSIFYWCSPATMMAF